MPTPDSLVASRGEDVVHSVITAAVYDAAGAFDESASSKTTTTIKAIVSLPSSKELFINIQSQPMLRLTVQSTVEVSAQRPGRPDRFTVRGEPYEVIEVRVDRHPFVSTRKTTVILTRVATPSQALT
jgi:hypothetical protein